MPKFPSFSNNKIVLEIPSSGHMYGQHFFCISVTADTLNDYGEALEVDHVYTVPESSVPSSLSSTFSNLV